MPKCNATCEDLIRRNGCERKGGGKGPGEVGGV